MSGFADSINRSQQHIDDIASSLGDFFKNQQEKHANEQFKSTLKSRMLGQSEVTDEAPLLKRKVQSIDTAKPKPTTTTPKPALINPSEAIGGADLEKRNPAETMFGGSLTPYEQNIQPIKAPELPSADIQAGPAPISQTSSPEFTAPPSQEKRGGMSRLEALQSMAVDYGDDPRFQHQLDIEKKIHDLSANKPSGSVMWTTKADGDPSKKYAYQKYADGTYREVIMNGEHSSMPLSTSATNGRVDAKSLLSDIVKEKDPAKKEDLKKKYAEVIALEADEANAKRGFKTQLKGLTMSGNLPVIFDKGQLYVTEKTGERRVYDPEIDGSLKAINEESMARNFTLRANVSAVARARWNMKDVIDKDTDEIVQRSNYDIATNPDKYMGSAQGAKALSKEAVIEDIRGNIVDTRKSIDELDNNFDEAFKTKLAVALKGADPKSAVSSLINSQFADNMTVSQLSFLNHLNYLTENAMAMRSVLGAGQGSEDLRNAIRNTLPGVMSPNKEYAKQQLDLFEKTLDRLKKGIPNTTPTNKKKNGVINLEGQY